MKVVILAGGYGTRLSEETNIKPKPMVNIGSQPILWHIMKIYTAYGLNDFLICVGYKGELIKQYFSNYFLFHSDVTFDIKNNKCEVHCNSVEPWTVTLIGTGQNTMTGGRIKRVQDFIGDETFCLTYGDGVSDINISDLIDFHRKQKTLATLTAIQPPGRYGVFTLEKEQNQILNFREKQWEGQAWINGGFFVLEPEVLDYIEGDDTIWEQEPMQRLSREGQLSAYRHEGFWQNMDTLHDKRKLERLWAQSNPPWKVW